MELKQSSNLSALDLIRRAFMPVLRLRADRAFIASDLCYGAFRYCTSSTLYRGGTEIFHAEGWEHTYADDKPPYERNARLGTRVMDLARPGDVLRVVDRYMGHNARMVAEDYRVVGRDAEGRLTVRPLPKSRQGRLNPT